VGRTLYACEPRRGVKGWQIRTMLFDLNTLWQKRLECFLVRLSRYSSYVKVGVLLPKSAQS
jgi:hypothetical protein